MNATIDKYAYATLELNNDGRVRFNAPLVIINAALLLAGYLIELVLPVSGVRNQQHWYA